MTPAGRHLNLNEANELAEKICQANERMANAEYVDDSDEAMFSDLVTRFFQAAPPEKVIALVKNGQIPKEHQYFGTPICLAAENGLFDLIEPLHAVGCGFFNSASGHNALTGAIDNAGLDPTHQTVLKLLDLQAELPDRASALRQAAGSAGASLVQALLERGLDPNEICPASGRAPLHDAFIAKRFADTGVLLLKAGADPNLTVRNGSNAALHFLAESGKSGNGVEQVFATMLECGLRIPKERTSDINPLQICLTHSNDVLAHLLLAQGVDPICALRMWDVAKHPRGDLPALVFEQLAMSNMPRTVEYMVEQLGFDPTLKLANGDFLADHVKDERTKSFLHAMMTRRAIEGSLPAATDTTGSPARRISPSL